MRKIINIILSLCLAGTVGATGFFGYRIFENSRKVIVPDFLGKNVSEVIEWCGKLSEPHGCEFVYEDSTTIDKDKVFKQSVSADNELTDKLIITVSSGLIQEIALPALNDNTTRADIEAWAQQNNIHDILFVEDENNDKINGTVLKIEPQPVYPNSEVIVHIAKSTKEKEPETPTTQDGEDIVIKAGTYVGLSEDDFKSKATSLGLKANHNSNKDDYSSTVEKGKVVWHGSGTYEKGEKFNYGLSLGKSSSSSSSSDNDLYIKAGTYVGKTESEIKTIATDKGLKANHKTEKDAYSDTVAKGSVVWHGSGQYVKDETFNYGLSLGKKGSDTSEDDLYVTSGKYVGKTESEFKTITTNLGLVPTHLSSRDSYSDTVAKGSIVTHGYGQYEKGEAFNYGLSLGKKGSDTTDDDLYVTYGQYIGKTESEFKTIATNKGLVANHKSTLDDYSDTVAKGNVVWHGSGQYEKDELFNYGLSLGKKGSDTSDDDLYIKAGTYVGKTEDEFKTIATNKGLKPNHKSEKDQYSDTIAKGSIVWHGSGQYVKDEAFNYGLSLGKQESTQTIQVSADQYVGKTESEFKTIAQTLGLNPTHLTSRDSYSDTVAKGSIVSHGYGSYTKGEDFNYGLSLGKKETPVVSTVYIMRPNYYSASDTFDGTKQTILNALGALQSLTFQAVTSTSGEAVGQITKITVGGDESYSAGNYTIDTPVVVYIVSKQGN